MKGPAKCSRIGVPDCFGTLSCPIFIMEQCDAVTECGEQYRESTEKSEEKEDDIE